MNLINDVMDVVGGVSFEFDRKTLKVLYALSGSKIIAENVILEELFEIIKGVKKYEAFDFSLDDLKDKLSSYDLSFKCLDMGSSVDISSKYDVVITSNLSEYFVNDLEKISNYKNNLDNILDSNGYIISSHMLNSYIPYLENSVFNSSFNSKEFPFYYDKFFNNYFPLGYCYQKKKDGVNKK